MKIKNVNEGTGTAPVGVAVAEGKGEVLELSHGHRPRQGITIKSINSFSYLINSLKYIRKWRMLHPVHLLLHC